MLSQVQHWLSQMHVPGTCAMTPKAGIVKFHRTQGLIPSNLTNLTQILCVVWSYLSHVLHLPTLAVLHQRFGHVSVFHHKGQFPELIILHLDDGGPVPISEDFSWPPPQNTRFTVCHHGFTCLVPWRHQSSASQTTNSYQDAGSRTHQAGPRPRPFHKHSPGGCLLELEVESEADHWHLDCTNYRPLRKPWQKLSRSTSHWSLPQNVPRLAQKKQQCTVLQCPKHRRQMPNCPTAMVAGRPKHFENSSDDLNDPRGKRFSNHPVGGITTILAINGEIFEIPKKIDQTLGHFHAFAYCKRFLHHSRGLD